jgi:hypothetical protein
MQKKSKLHTFVCTYMANLIDHVFWFANVVTHLEYAEHRFECENFKRQANLKTEAAAREVQQLKVGLAPCLCRGSAVFT